ncbi:uncharacterized protein F4812DRAFT_300693 [Daldinia caldariorum]|uniref:uncharacterized protein n=1 Tax=Daldinia caldariorum TaxID=326644 RepID=UPI002008E91B|nr:uncharacterized protein F4812DRAFT_300693 [Daldinia caldariorum]KAI1469710.1 hypothetical protein F4812DRAFT_300693 [Daldinia caldariorum]
MFRRLSHFRRKDRDENRVPRFHRTASEPQSSNPSPSGVSEPIRENQVESRASLHSSAPVRVANGDLNSRRHSETEAGPLGLTVVYTPENAHKADIVFIHGLGGTSRWTWSKNKDPDLFWPLTFLPLEPDLCLARILTFGYNANFRKSGNIGTSVLDFAKDLLFDLKFAKDDHKEDLRMGSVPLIFVVHSMGGLIVKEAYMQGQNDPEYESIIKAISAITFLATPHRGTHLAETLNRILQTAMITNSKQYISDLAKNSFTLQKLNEQFRHIAPRLDIVSFYETQPTAITSKSPRIMVLEKDSSVLGYPGETSKALNADHHGVCKYESPRDPNYITVRNVLKSLLSKIISTSNSRKPGPSSRRESHDLRSFLVITEIPAIDYSFFRDQWVRGTCEWVLQDKDFIEWYQVSEPTSSLLWLSGGAATGKSVLSSFIINYLVERDACCQYYFIRFGDQKKRTLSSLLRSIAYQIALTIPSFLQRLLELTDEAVDYETADPRTIWERLFKSILFNMEDQKPLYWVIDGLDEAHDPRAIIKLLSDVAFSSIPLRIVLVSRRISEIESAFQKVSNSLRSRTINIEGHLEDLRCYVRQELSMSGGSEFKENIIQRIVEGSQNNFLWVRLAVSKLNLCHRLADVEIALQELPVGMEALYDRMASSIAQRPSPTDRSLASSMLQCIACSFRGLTVTELSQALDEDISEILDFERSIVDLCGGFVAVDNGGNVVMIHQTAREYLLSDNGHPFSIDPQEAHERMFKSCMKCLMTIGLRAKVNRNQKPEFIDYASTYWSSHLMSTSFDSEQVGKVLKKFLTSHWVLTWIHILASNNQQRILIQASRNLSKYCLRQRRYYALQTDRGQQIVERELLESWSIDFVKLVGKFGIHLRRDPESIYKLIPPFCPRSSSVYQFFGKAEVKNIAVSGISTENWDDSLARISPRSGSYASSISASGNLVCILASPGHVYMYDCSTFEETPSSPIQHGERLYRMELNSTASLLVTYGYTTIKVWETSSGKCKFSVNNIPSKPRPLSIRFIRNSTSILIGSEDRRIRSFDLSDESSDLELVAELEEPELEGHFLNSSNYMALNNDGTLIAVAYRGHPLSAWEIDGPVHIGHCWRTREEAARGEVIDAVWHPHSPEILGLYIEGVVFKWRPYDGAVIEMPTGASRLAISGDGNLLATGDAHGTVKVHTTSDLGLLYQLTSQDTVLGLTFSPDHRRFYDIRGYYGNAWEPNALMKFSDQTEGNIDGGSETESLNHSLSMYSNSTKKVDSITVLAAAPTGRLYSYGTETGAVHIVDLHKEKDIDVHAKKGFLSIEQMSWSQNGRYMCFADSSKKVYIKSITPGTSTSEPVAETKAEISMKTIAKGPITQLLFQPNSKSLLVLTSKSAHTISIETLTVIQSVELDAPDCRWIAHPEDMKLVVGFGNRRIQITTWDLIQVQAYATNLGDHAVVNRVLATQDKMHLLVQTSSEAHNSKEKELHYFKSSDLGVLSESTTTIIPKTFPRDISSEVALPLAFRAQDRLIYLSGNFSVCSWRLSSDPNTHNILMPSNHTTPTESPGTHNRHQSNNSIANQSREIFVLPGDWVNRDCLSLCTVWGAERSFLCPRNGEVAVVRCRDLI